jgi:Ca2+-binding EF-hand superfamily protein
MSFARTCLLSPVLLALVLGGTPAAAQGRNPDLDRDGKLSLPEYRGAYVNGMFGWLDKDKDGAITRAEFATLEKLARRFGGQRGAWWAARMRSSDADGDGAISRRELEAHATSEFKATDLNQDGQLDKAELKASRKRLEAEAQAGT